MADLCINHKVLCWFNELAMVVAIGMIAAAVLSAVILYEP